MRIDTFIGIMSLNKTKFMKDSHVICDFGVC